MLEILSPYLLPVAGGIGAVLVGWHGKAWLASAQAKAQQAMAAANLAPRAMTAMERLEALAAHPVDSFESWEHQMAADAAELATKGITHLVDTTPEDVKIKAANDVKALKAKLRADVLAKLQPPA